MKSAIYDGFCYRRLCDKKVFRVFAVCPDEGFVVVARQCCTSTRLQRVPICALLNGLATRTFTPVVLEQDSPLPEEVRGDASEIVFQKIKPAIEKLLAPGFIALSGRRMWKDIKSAAAEIQIPAITLKQAFTRILQAGGAIDAAAPRWHRCGRKKSAGPTEDFPFVGTNQPMSYGLSVVDFGKIRKGVKDWLRDGRTWQEAYDEFLKADYPAYEKIVGDKAITVPLPAGQRPSIGQFIRHGCRLVPYEERLIQQIGELAVQTDKRGRPSGQSYDAIYPGHVSEIDWTLVDNVAVARGSRLAVGRLVLYAIADVGSGLVQSVYCTLNSASVEEAGHAIMVCMEDKVELCARVGLVITPEMWNSTSLFRELRSDKGEIESWKASGLVSHVGLKLEHCPARRGDLKGTIESFFNIVRWRMRKLRGATAGHRERLKDHPNVTAIYDMNQLTRLLYATAIEWNWRKRRRQARTEGMVADQVAAVPQLLFNWAEERGCMRQVEMDTLRIGALPTYFASVTVEGITIDGLRFLVPEFEPLAPDGIQPNAWMMEAKRRTWEVEVGIDRSTVDFIWLRHRRPGKKVAVIRCEISSEHSGFKGLTWSEYEFYSGRIKANSAAASGIRSNIKAWALAVVADTTVEAKATTEAAREGLSATAQIGGASERKEMEKQSVDMASLGAGSAPGPTSTGGADFDDEQWVKAKANRNKPTA